MVYVHGGPGTGSYDFAQIQGERLSRRLRIVLFDQRGVLRSDPLPNSATLTLADLAADLDALRDALNVRRWTVLGHSFGGLIAVRYATLHPRAVRGLLLENPTLDLTASLRLLLLAARELLTEAEDANDVDSTAQASALDGPALMRAVQGTLSQLGERRNTLFVRSGDPAFFDKLAVKSCLGPRWGQAASHLDALLDDPKIFKSVTPDLVRLKSPILLMRGAYDHATDPASLDAFKRLARGGRLETFDNCAHFLRYEDPDRYARAVEAFVLNT